MLAFTFPGQGSQRPGMGAPWVDHPSFELVEYASDVVGRDVAELLLEADQATLTATANAQLATFVLSLVVLDATERLGLEPTAAAGHSLGEYTALVATGALSYDDGLRLVAERGAAMADAAEQANGTMLAVLGLGDDDVEAACSRADGDVWVANFNAPNQVVIAGAPVDLERAGEIARSLGAKRVLPLPVGGAFHTPYMAPARERLRKALASVTFHDPDPAVVANVDARAHGGATEWSDLLSAQLCSPVRWRHSLGALFASGTRTFLELGPGGVLTGLAKRTLTSQDTTCLSVSTPAELELLVELLAGGTTLQHVGAVEERVIATTASAATTAPYAMTERLVVSPATGPFTPVDQLAAAGPRLKVGRRAIEPDAGVSPGVELNVGDLVGWSGSVEIRSPFAGRLEGLLVLAGERVVTGQPVAWLRARTEENV